MFPRRNYSQASNFQTECTCPSGKWIVKITCLNVPFTCLSYTKPMQLMWKSERCSRPWDKSCRYSTCPTVTLLISDNWRSEISNPGSWSYCLQWSSDIVDTLYYDYCINPYPLFMVGHEIMVHALHLCSYSMNWDSHIKSFFENGAPNHVVCRRVNITWIWAAVCRCSRYCKNSIFNQSFIR